MIKQEVVAALGQQALVRPTRVREALKANDRLKLYLTSLQAAQAHAASPERPALDLANEIAAADIRERDEADWLRSLPAAASLEGGRLLLPGFERLVKRLQADLATMADPVISEPDADPAIQARVQQWQERLLGVAGDALDDAQIADLARGRRAEGDSLHLLVMDLHKALNRIAASLQGEDIDGAHAWGLSDAPQDRACIRAFMRGLARTRHAKLDHPGLDTSATRDGARLLIQNDIGTNDAHVLVLQVEDTAVSLTYSDLHRSRFRFFCDLLAQVGASWSDLASHTTAGLNEGNAYHVGTARWHAADAAGLEQCLEAIGSRIVFLIDWNRARKRLQRFVDKPGAVAVLTETARRECGHMAWLVADGERLVWSAMAAQGDEAFRLGDRLDEVLGDEVAREFLIGALVLAGEARQKGRPVAYVADELRLLLGRSLRALHLGVDLLSEHAAWCHALAQGLRDALAHGSDRDAAAAAALATRAKGWERAADELVVRGRARAARRARGFDDSPLLQQADDVADALEEACFVLSLVAQRPEVGWDGEVRRALQALADAVLGAVQDHVRAVALLGAVDGGGVDHAQALDVLWRVVQAERQCDELLRAARRALAREARDAVSLTLGNELAAAMEAASDHLLAVGHALRRRALEETGAVA